ncbi:sulfite exporter TauE/SafE family protein [Paludibacterium yongneupense]|uniref:sulfite exporter TauE/SafE family protein n=1 Tax=Paludibacterium yongneupense TaxID=400061 RepID=UPI0004256EC1|nr:sulfite exporter TauE/SafE family protein [Paludibacterium yongneupense]
MLTILILGFAVGGILGLTGAGGGILATPALMAGLGWSVQHAAPVALLAVCAGASVGVAEGFYRHQVRYRAATLMALAGLPFSALGIRLARHVPVPALSAVFALVMLWVASRGLARNGREQAPPCRHDPATGRLRWNATTALSIAAIGAASGILTGLLGVGGGFVIVPALRRLTDLGMHAIVATSLLVITLVGGGSVVVAVLGGAHFPVREATGFVAAAVAGMAGGRVLIHRLDARQIQTGFACVVAAVAVGMLLKLALS